MEQYENEIENVNTEQTSNININELILIENREDIEDYLNSLKIDSGIPIKTHILRFSDDLIKIHGMAPPAQESSVSDSFNTFLVNLSQVKISNNPRAKFILIEGLIRLLKYSTKNDLYIQLIKVLLSLCEMRLVKNSQLKKIFLNLDKKISTDLECKLMDLYKVHSSQFNYIYFFSNLLQLKKISTNFRNFLQKLFINYYENEILDDTSKEVNLVKQRSISELLIHINLDLLYETIFPRCEALLLRSIKNYQFLETALTNFKSCLSEVFLNDILSKFSEFFFNSDKQISESALNSFKSISTFSSQNRRVLLVKLLEMEFSADKSDLNLNTCNYLTVLLNAGKYSEVPKLNFYQDKYFTVPEVIEITEFILRKLEQTQNENNKPKLEIILENLILGLMKTSKTGSSPSTGTIFNMIQKLISSSTYSYFYSYLYTLITIMLDKFELAVNPNSNKTLIDNLFNNIKDISLTISNSKNILALISACSTLLSKTLVSTQTSNANKKLLQLLHLAIKVLIGTSMKNFNTAVIEFSNILNIFKQITLSKNEQLLDYFAGDGDTDDVAVNLAKIIVHTSFCLKSNKLSERIFYNDFINNLSKKHCEYLINFSFLFLLKSVNKTNLEKLTFNRVGPLIKRFSYFYQEFDDRDFLKFTLLLHVPNIYNNANIQKCSKFTKLSIENQITRFISGLGIQTESELGTVDSDCNNNFYEQFDMNYKSLSQFIFSDLGLFSKVNDVIVNTCYGIITRLLKLQSSFNFGSKIVQSAFLNLNTDQFIYIDELRAHYSKQVEYISFYDLGYLIDNLKSLEKNYYNSCQLENENKLPENLPISNKIVSKNTKNNNKNAGGNVPAEKVDKETKFQEYKNYLEKFLINLSLHQIFIISRLTPIINLLNNQDNHKKNLQLSIKHFWGLLKCNATSKVLTNTLINLFRNNVLTKSFCVEFSHLMYLEVNPSQFALIMEKHPHLVIQFNEKFTEFMNNNSWDITPAKDTGNPNLFTTQQKLFEYFDFVVIRLLYCIILNPNITNENKISAVNILVKILEKLPSINFNDISNLAVNLLKTSYNHENLAELLEILLTKSKEEHFLMIFSDILEYEYVAQVTFLQQIINLNMRALRKYRNLVYKIWILIFNENENIAKLAKEIWNSFDLFLDLEFINSHEFGIAFTQHNLKDSAARSIRAYAFINTKSVNSILTKFEKFYEKEVSEGTRDTESGNELPIRSIIFDFINETVELFTSEMKQSLLDFLMRISDCETEEEIFTQINKSIFNIINSIDDEVVVENTLKSIEKNIKIISEKSNNDVNIKNLKIILMMLSSFLCNEETIKKCNNSIYESLYNPLFALCSKLENTETLLLVSRCYQYLSRGNSDRSQILLLQILENFRKSHTNLINIGELYILAGLVKYFGISTYKSLGIAQLIAENAAKNKSIIDKKNALMLIRVFSSTLKRLFEPYLVGIFDLICELIADREESVREYAHKTVKSFMKELSGFGVKTIMPRLIKDLHSMNWRSKVVNIEILGQFAFCAPKQLSIYIPVVVKELMQVFKDPHQRVQEVAIRVLNDISSVIKNPEIVELSGLLIDAISNPYDHSKNALQALLETNFKHAIDPPSLALIIPIIDYNLKVQSEQLKKMSAHLIGSIASLISDPLDIYQYLDIIIPNLKYALFDAIPDVRNSMAKAIGSLTKSLGRDYLSEMLNWVKGYLETDTDTVQRSGAAQAYSEMLVSFGEAFIDNHILSIISKIQESDYIAKEGYLSIFVFLPGCLCDKFEKYFELIFPLIIDGFSDEHENVRNVSNKIFEICIKLFAKRNAKQLVDPLLIRLFDANWRIRNSSIALIKTLIMNLNKEFFKEQSEYFTKEQRDEIMINTFILKADQSGNTATIANMIWRDYVDNIPKYLSRVLKQIYEQLMVLLSSENDERFDIAEGCIKMLVTKFSDKFFMEMMPLIKDTISKAESENQVYASFYIIQLAASEASEKLLSAYRERLIRLVNENINTSYSSVRKLLASIIYELSRKFFDQSINRNFIFGVMKQARGKSTQDQKNILEIVGNIVDISKGEVLGNVKNEIFRKPFEEGFISLVAMISDDLSASFRDPTDVKEIYDDLTEAMQFVPNSAIESIVSITCKLDENYLNNFTEFLDQLKIKIEVSGNNAYKNFPVHISEIILKYIQNTFQDYSAIEASLMNINTSLLSFNQTDGLIDSSDNAEYLVKNVGESIQLLVEKCDKTDIDKFLQAFLSTLADIEANCRQDLLPNEIIFEKINSKFKLIMDNLISLVQNGLLYAEDKILASNYVQNIIDYTTKQTLKSYIMKLIGPMIRILSEKYSPTVKEKILDVIRTLIIKSREDVKGISPQLLSVFVKTLTDTSQNSQPNAERSQLKSGENILRLLQFYPRADVIANDLIKSICLKFEKNEMLQTSVEIEILSDVIRFYGSGLKVALMQDHYSKIQALINGYPEAPYDQLAILLSSYTKYIDISEGNCSISEELPRKLFNFITIFNGNEANFDKTSPQALKIIKSLPKDQAIILLKSLGKVFNKYKYFQEFDTKTYGDLLLRYESVIRLFILETELFNVTNHILDANLCVFMLSLGYLNSYSESEQALFYKVFYFLIGLIQQAKVNSQLLVNLLSLLLLKEIKIEPDKVAIIEALDNMDLDEDTVDIVNQFLKKIYYLYG